MSRDCVDLAFRGRVGRRRMKSSLGQGLALSRTPEASQSPDNRSGPAADPKAFAAAQAL